MSNPTAVVTGGAGFLGSHLTDKLLEENFNIVCVDNLITGTIDNISHLAGNDNFSFVKHDVTNYIFIPGRVDYILHFASPASPNDYLNFPIQTLKVGSLGTHKALGLAKEKNATFLLASTSEVYGDPTIHPQSEDYWGNVNPIGLRGVYDEAKRFAEAITMAYHRYHNVDTRIGRLFNTYGPRMRQDDGRAMPTFITQALNEEDITVYGDGSQTRSFCYVSDQVEGIFKLLMSKESEPVNLGNPEEVSIKDFAEEVKQITKSNSNIVFKKLPSNDPKVRQPDISKAIELLGWKPNVDRMTGIEQTVKYFVEKIKSQN